MSEDAQELFHAVIAATDNASKTLEAIRQRIQGISNEHEHLEHTGAHTFESLSGHINLLRTRFGTLRTSIGETIGSFGEFMPMLAGLGAAGTLAGLFELTAHVAESQAVLAHTALVIGVTTQALQRLDFAATMTDTNVESMQNAMTKLNRAIGQGSKNKEAASLFHHLGISTKDATGHLRSAADLMPQLADAFAHTQSAAMRTRMAMALFGRAGADMLPMLMRGRAGVAELMDQAGTVGHVSTDEQVKAGVEYADSLKLVTAAIQGFKDTLGDALTPVLKPILDGMRDWIVLNRQWIADDIAGGVKKLGDWLKTINLGTVIRDTTDFLHRISDLTTSLGGLTSVLIGVGVVMGAEFVGKLLETTMIVKEFTAFLWGPAIEAAGAFATSLFATRDAAFALDFALDANPFGVFLGAVALVGAAAFELWEHWAWVKAQFTALYGWFEGQSGWSKAIMLGVAPLIFAPMEIIKHWDGIKAFFTGLWADVKRIFDGAMGWMNPILSRLGSFEFNSAGSDGGLAMAGGGGGSVALPSVTVAPRVNYASVLPPSGQAGAGGAGGAAGASGRVQVDLHVHGATPDTRVRAKSSGNASTTIQVDRGQAWD